MYLQVNLFHSGCVIAEIRDLRRHGNSASYDTQYVLLHPTQEVCWQNHLPFF